MAADCVRRAAEGDLSRVAEILVFGKRVAYRAIFADDIGSFNGLRVLDVADAYRRGERALGDALVYDDGVVKGVLGARFGGEEAELDELYVEPFFTGRGVGGALIKRFLAEARARGCTRARLWVIRRNDGARRFYEAHGFSPDGRARPVAGTSVEEMGYARSL